MSILPSVKRIMIIIVIFVVAATSTASCGINQRDVILVVPNLRNLNKPTAEKILETRGMKLQIIEEKFSENLPKDSVISQIPDPGEMIKSTRAVSVVLSKGRGKVKMPKLIGKSFRIAKKEIDELNLKLGGINEVESFHNPVGTVEGQFPAEGTEIGKYSPVTLTISIGSYLIMPDLIDMSLDDAVLLVKESGFNGERVRQIQVEDINTYNSTPPGYVVRQDPEAGLQIDSENPIDIYYKP